MNPPPRKMPGRDVNRIVNALPNWLLDAMRQDPSILVAGGFCRAVIARETPKDVDVWTPEGFNICEHIGDGMDMDALIPPKVPTDGWFCDPNAWTRRWHDEPVPVSFVFCKRFSSLEACVTSFDFTVCQAGVRWDKAKQEFVGLVGCRFYEDLAAKDLVLTNAADGPVSTLCRVGRYIGYGYAISRPELFKLLLAVKELDIEEISEELMDDYS